MPPRVCAFQEGLPGAVWEPDPRGCPQHHRGRVSRHPAQQGQIWPRGAVVQHRELGLRGDYVRWGTKGKKEPISWTTKQLSTFCNLTLSSFTCIIHLQRPKQRPPNTFPIGGFKSCDQKFHKTSSRLMLTLLYIKSNQIKLDYKLYFYSTSYTSNATSSAEHKNGNKSRSKADNV